MQETGQTAMYRNQVHSEQIC